MTNTNKDATELNQQVWKMAAPGAGVIVYQLLEVIEEATPVVRLDKKGCSTLSVMD